LGKRKVIAMIDQNVAYSPEELAGFKTVFDDAIASLSPLMLTTGNRLRIAQNVLACAATGERDAAELGLAALASLRAV
jgi:acetyl-CoA acetyltransferase